MSAADRRQRIPRLPRARGPAWKGTTGVGRCSFKDPGADFREDWHGDLYKLGESRFRRFPAQFKEVPAGSDFSVAADGEPAHQQLDSLGEGRCGGCFAEEACKLPAVSCDVAYCEAKISFYEAKVASLNRAEPDGFLLDGHVCDAN